MNAEQFRNLIIKATTPLPGSIPYTAEFILSVKLKNDGLTVIDLYSKAFKNVSKDTWQKKIEDGLLTVNGEKCNHDTVLKAGWMTKNTVHDKTEPFISNAIELIYEDENLLVVHKPSPLPMHPSGRFNKNSLIEILKKALPNQELRVVHRLDANTTGVVVLAKNNQTANEISKQFQSNSIRKEYYALVDGIMEEDNQVITEKIGTVKSVSGSREISNEGQRSKTKITVLERDFERDSTLLKVEPENGRTNQIRLHLASIDHAIIGDLGYKDQSYFENNPMTYETDSLYLHAHSLTFQYMSNEVKFESKIPTKYFCRK